jgi:hypothetical protein
MFKLAFRSRSIHIPQEQQLYDCRQFNSYPTNWNWFTISIDRERIVLKFLLEVGISTQTFEEAIERILSYLLTNSFFFNPAKFWLDVIIEKLFENVFVGL